LRPEFSYLFWHENSDEAFCEGHNRRVTRTFAKARISYEVSHHSGVFFKNICIFKNAISKTTYEK